MHRIKLHLLKNNNYSLILKLFVFLGFLLLRLRQLRRLQLIERDSRLPLLALRSAANDNYAHKSAYGMKSGAPTP